MSQLPRQGLLLKGDNGYPDGLVAVLGRDAPSRVSWLGNLALLEQPALGFCGSRKATEKGLEAAADCAAQAAEIGIVVVSGYAAGVDASAHFQALANGGSTIIVLPEGISFFRVRAELKPVWSWGNVLVISQFQDDERWQSFRAMARNKVIIGLSDAMIVIEAGETGGTMDAGRSTLRYSRPLFVAQYEDMRTEARGNKYLIELGAQPLNRLRSNGRANMRRVWDTIGGAASGPRQPSLM